MIGATIFLCIKGYVREGKRVEMTNFPPLGFTGKYRVSGDSAGRQLGSRPRRVVPLANRPGLRLPDRPLTHYSVESLLPHVQTAHPLQLERLL